MTDLPKSVAELRACLMANVGTWGAMRGPTTQRSDDYFEKVARDIDELCRLAAPNAKLREAAAHLTELVGPIWYTDHPSLGRDYVTATFFRRDIVKINEWLLALSKTLSAAPEAAKADEANQVCCNDWDTCQKPCVARGRHQRNDEVAELRAKLEAVTKERDDLKAKAAEEREWRRDMQRVCNENGAATVRAIEARDEAQRDLAAARADQRAVAELRHLRAFSLGQDARAICTLMDKRIAALTAPAADPAKSGAFKKWDSPQAESVRGLRIGLVEALSLLRKHEWAGTDDMEMAYCPECDGYQLRGRHLPDCRLAALLAKHKETK